MRRWADAGKIQVIKTPSGQRRYDIQGYTAQFVSDRTDIIYCRVSSRAQKPDLERQIEAVKGEYPEAEVVAEIGGGLNFKRKKLLTILGRIMSGTVSKLIVAHKDRLARFGFDLFQWLCEQNGCELVVLSAIRSS